MRGKHPGGQSIPINENRSKRGLPRGLSKASVLFVCTGNICRSPTAAGVLARMVREAGLEQRIEVDSAGTGDWHVGEGADSRALQAALGRGYDLSPHRARQLQALDFHRFDLVIAMDEEHRVHMARLAKPTEAHKIRMMTEFARRHPGTTHVPDPYFGDRDGFELVLDLLEDAAAGLLEELRGALEP